MSCRGATGSVPTRQEIGMNIRLLGATTLAAALATAGCATSPGYGGGYSSAPSYGSSVCTDCGTVTRIQAVARGKNVRSEEHTSELQSLMRISYAVFCLK